eukprot:347852-Prymnesium_polylepis.1
MGGTAVGNATWSIANDSVPSWLHLASLDGAYTSLTDEAEIVELTAVTSGLREAYENYDAQLQLSVVSDAVRVFYVPVLLRLSAPDSAPNGTWGAVLPPAFDGAPRASCTTAIAITTTAAIEAMASFQFTSCDAEAMPVAHSLPSTDDTRLFTASVRFLGNGSTHDADVITHTYGVYR